MALIERTPEALLAFWFGSLREAADATGDNWRERQVLWKIGPFARASEDRRFLLAQRQWCERIHVEGVDGFFAHPDWQTPLGMLAKLIVLDQFPRSVWRGTPPAYAYASITEPLAREICERGWDMSEYNVIERMWVYMPLTHSESLTLQELAVDKFIRWSPDLLAAAGSDRRKVNQYVSWAFLKSTIEHSEVLLIYGRFPHRNAILGRPLRGGEPRYLSDPMRPLWTFTQPPQPDYFALLAALYGIDGNLDEGRIPQSAVAALHRVAGQSTKPSRSLLDIYDIRDADAVDYPTLYRHLRLREKADVASELFSRAPVAEKFDRVKALILVDPEESWPPRSAKRSIQPVIDVAAINALVRGDGPDP